MTDEKRTGGWEVSKSSVSSRCGPDARRVFPPETASILSPSLGALSIASLSCSPKKSRYRAWAYRTRRDQSY